MEQARQSLIIKHNQLVNQLEKRYMDFMHQLLQQKAIIHRALQQQLYHNLSKIDNYIRNTPNKKHKQNLKQNLRPKPKLPIKIKTETKIPPPIPFVILPLTKQNDNKTNKQKSIKNNSKSKPFQCNICKNRFGTKTSLERHQRFHTGEKPYKCIYCHQRFVRNDYLKKHIQKIHSNIDILNNKNNKILTIGKWKCNICNKHTINEYDWNKHIEIHKAEKSFQCKLCNNTFRLKHFLKQHMKKVHPSSI